jgi:DNA-directed RNA polymerase specialized sigma24 family protein
VEAARDSGDVRDGDETILRLFVAARRACDGPAVDRLWRELVTLNFPRVQQLVYLESNGRLSREEEQDAVQLAAMRIMLLPRRRRGFDGSSKGELISLFKLVVHGACVDTQRGETRHSRNRASLHTAGEDGDERYTRDAYEALLRDDAEREDAERTQQELRALSEKFLAWALPRLNKNQRAMIECDLQGLAVEEIQDRMGRKRDAVYKLRERSMKALMKLREEYEA